MSFCQGIRPDQDGRPHRFLVEHRAYADRMADNDVALEVLHLIGRDDLVFESPEPGVDAVVNLAGGERLFNTPASPMYLLASTVGDPHLEITWQTLSHFHHVS